jgi:hypothetical protein
MSLRVPPREVAQRVVMKHQSLGNRESKMNLLFICIWHAIKAGDVSVVRFCRSVGCSVGFGGDCAPTLLCFTLLFALFPFPPLLFLLFFLRMQTLRKYRSSLPVGKAVREPTRTLLPCLHGFTYTD